MQAPEGNGICLQAVLWILAEAGGLIFRMALWLRQHPSIQPWSRLSSKLCRKNKQAMSALQQQKPGASASYFQASESATRRGKASRLLVHFGQGLVQVMLLTGAK